MRNFTKWDIATIWLAVLAWKNGLQEARTQNQNAFYDMDWNKEIAKTDKLIEKIQLWYNRRK